MATPEENYETLRSAIARPGDEASLPTLLALWYLRNILAVDDLEAYEYVLDSDGPIAAIYPESGFDEGEPKSLHVIGAVTTDGPDTYDSNVVEVLYQAAEELRAGESEGMPRDLVNAVRRYDVVDALNAERFSLQPDLLLTGEPTDEAEAAAADTGVEIYPLSWLAAVARALEGPGLLEEEVVVPVPEHERFEASTAVGNILIAEVPAREIATWPGIDDRSLFGLNVRGELRGSRIFDELNDAIRDRDQHPNFLAFHNGLTVICRDYQAEDDVIRVDGLSVVNGAQSVLAFRRNHDALEDDSLRVIVKFVQDDGHVPGFATEVARRSNTQAAVNARNLRANDARQQTLVAEFYERYPDYAYIVKPEATVQPPGEPIRNDEAAQWLCSVYNERPWLAVKRIELFKAPNYSLIFSAQIHADHILLLHHLRSRIDAQQQAFPDAYLRSWRLVAVMAMYLAGQYMRGDETLHGWLNAPRAALGLDEEELNSGLDSAARAAGGAMVQHHDERLREFDFDDFKVDFKREGIARDLARRLAKTQRASLAT